MKYTEEMILHADSGYCMPVEEPRGKDVELSLGYGEQVHPTTGEKFFHHEMCIRDRAKRIYWFESAYDAMAYYQLNPKWDKELRKGVFVSTGGAPSQQQFKACLLYTSPVKPEWRQRVRVQEILGRGNQSFRRRLGAGHEACCSGGTSHCFLYVYSV